MGAVANSCQNYIHTRQALSCLVYTKEMSQKILNIADSKAFLQLLFSMNKEYLALVKSYGMIEKLNKIKFNWKISTKVSILYRILKNAEFSFLTDICNAL